MITDDNYYIVKENLILNEKTKVSSDTEEETRKIQENQENYNDILLSEEDEKKSIWIRLFGPIKEGSLRGSVLAMASITFGGGCLAFSSAIKNMGLINGLLLFFFVALISFYTLSILTESGKETGIFDYNKLIEEFLGKKMVIFSDVNNLILCLGVIIGYQKYIYQFALDILKYYFDIESTEEHKYEILIILVCFVFIQIPLTSMKKIAVLQYASIFGSLALIYSIVVIIVKMPENFAKNNNPDNRLVLFEDISLSYLVSISIFLFGFSSHNGIFQIYVELKNRSAQRYAKVLNRSFMLEVILYLLMSLGGYISFLGKTDGNILKNYNSDEILILVSKITLFICLHCSMAINYNIMRQSYRSFFLKDGEKKFVWYKDLFFAILTLMISNAIVYNLKSSTQILGIVGGVCTVVICFLNPILIYIKVFKPPISSFKFIFSMFVLFFVIILGTAATVYSTYDYIMQIINHTNDDH